MGAVRFSLGRTTTWDDPDVVLRRVGEGGRTTRFVRTGVDARPAVPHAGDYDSVLAGCDTARPAAREPCGVFGRMPGRLAKPWRRRGGGRRGPTENASEDAPFGWKWKRELRPATTEKKTPGDRGLSLLDGAGKGI